MLFNIEDSIPLINKFRPLKIALDVPKFASYDDNVLEESSDVGLLLACRLVFNMDDCTKVITKQLRSDCTLLHCEVFIPYI